MTKEQKKITNNQNNRIRNRLVGLATLLLILALIAPWVLTDKSNLRSSTTPILQPNITEVEPYTDPLTPIDIPVDLTPTEPESKPYMIQLTALKNRQKIEELVALLRLNNYNVIVIPENPEPNQLIKLQVGPYAKKEQAEQVIINLNNLTKLKGFIVAN